MKNHILLSQQESVHDKLKVNGLLLQRINMGTVSHGITFPLVTSPACSDTTPGISFQSAIRTQVLIVTTPTSILETPSIYFVSYLTTHVREIIPTIAPSIASLHLLRWLYEKSWKKRKKSENYQLRPHMLCGIPQYPHIGGNKRH